ncbi:drug/metabolite transporter (DMT)-like permease [Nocardioides aromaticivorans]|uniref:Drug/metabolite transporter (DMT)-like permease n=1 Tax=Nocardioides aromaticivorans TaxID=200618 RepID=A0A7Z0CQG2_9ACTN|nr:DMT family transporter [Nocardioides aromaticivorans]NYI46802.1 drug/metabolite transporter (DMT)-like permease [Nocardioides aromaticivorans]
MTTLTRDAPVVARRDAGTGLLLAIVSAATFGMSGALARPLLDSGWTAGGVVLLRIAVGALAVLPFGIAAMRGRWHLLGKALPTVVLYGILAVAGAQFCYFSAVQTMEVGPALLIEYTAPAAVVVWMWAAHGQRPGRLTVVGAAVAALGLLLVLDLFSGADFDVRGAAWALGAMVGAAAYFVISADDRSGLPPMALATGGLIVGGAFLGLIGLLGLMPVRTASAHVEYAGLVVAPWVAILALGLVTAALAYGTGIAASRRLGSRLASFVALSEVVLAVLWAWALLGQLPGPVQFAGGALILVGVVGVKLGERTVEHEEPVLA